MINKKAKIEYTIYGNGSKKVIVTHSWMDDYESWLPTIPSLNLKEYTFAFIDVRGYGKSKNIKGTYNSDEIANDLFSVADELGWEQFYLIGHSMCGMAAQKAALLDKNNRIKKVILITPVSAGGFPANEETLGFFNAIVQSEETSKVAFGVFTSNRLSGTWMTKRAKRHVEVTNKEAQTAYIKMWVEEDFLNKMKDVSTPFLVLSGKYDHPQFQLKEQKEVFKNFQNVTFLEIENSGHFPMQETPIFLAATIENYI